MDLYLFEGVLMKLKVATQSLNIFIAVIATFLCHSHIDYSLNGPIFSSQIRKDYRITTVKKLSNFFMQFKVCYARVSGPVQTTCSNTLSSIRTRHFYCVYINPTKDSVIYVCLHAHALQITLHCSPARRLNVSLFLHMHSMWRDICTVVQFVFFSLCIGNHFYI